MWRTPETWLGLAIVVVALGFAVWTLREASRRPKDIRSWAAFGAIAAMVVGAIGSQMQQQIGWYLLVALGLALGVGSSWDPQARLRRGTDLWDVYRPLLRDDLATCTRARAEAAIAWLDQAASGSSDSELAALLREDYAAWLGQSTPEAALPGRSVWRAVRIHELAVTKWADSIHVDRARAERRWRLWLAMDQLRAASVRRDAAQLAALAGALPVPKDRPEIDLVTAIHGIVSSMERGGWQWSEEADTRLKQQMRRVWPDRRSFAGAVAGPWAAIESDSQA